MKRLALLGAVVLMTALATPAFARPLQVNGPADLVLVQTWKSLSCNVEQQTIHVYGSFDPAAPCPGEFVVNNPTTCMWDIDDSWTLFGSGRIETGQTVTASFCAIADGTHRASVDAEVSAKSDQLTVRLDGSDGRFWVAAPLRVGSAYRYVICADNFIQLFPHPDVPDSNGGRGTFVTYTLTIAAPTHGANDVGAMLDYGQGAYFVSGC